jgi:RNA polymerase sigma-70 factor, ECF subfamily
LGWVTGGKHAGPKIIRKRDEHSLPDRVRNELDQHLPALWRFALVLTRNRDAAQDLVQSTCLRALEKGGLFDQQTRLDRWLMTMMMNIRRNELRAVKVRTGTGLEDAETVLSFDGGAQIETNVFASEVLTAIGSLPGAQRETVLLVYLEGWSYAEAAATLGVPIGTVMSRLAAARSRLAGMDAREAASKANR